MDTTYWLQFSEADLIDLASGYVPLKVRAEARLLLDTDEDDRRRAQRPVKVPKKTARTHPTRDAAGGEGR